MCGGGERLIFESERFEYNNSKGLFISLLIIKENAFDLFAAWEVIECRAFSDFLDDSDMWCKYSSLTAPTYQLRANAKILEKLFSIENDRKNY